MPKINQKHYRHARQFNNLLFTESQSVPRFIQSLPEVPDHEQTPPLNIDAAVDGDGSDSDIDDENFELASLSSNSSSEFELTDHTVSHCKVPEFSANTENCSPPTLCDLLADWAVRHKISQVAVNDLLKILNPFHKSLPLDARTLLETPRQYEIKLVEPGSYHHFGIDKCLVNLLSNCDSTELINLSILEVLINIDGLPLAKSSSSQVYPILCSLVKNPTVVEIIGIYHGYQKPNDPNRYLAEFVAEVIFITENGFVFGDKTYEFKIKGFVCDVPAKSFILLTKGHSGYFSCSKCDIEGSYVDGRVCFPEQNFKLRTDSDFRQKIQDEHHNGTSVIEEIPNFNMIDNFVLDPMHLLYLGVVKKLIHLWCTGKPPSKLSLRDIEKISESLVLLKGQIPCEFNRKPRALVEYKRWKATEFRQFLLYTGPLVLKRVLNKDMYLNFLSLHVAVTILSTERLQSQFIEEADSCLKFFFRTFLILYGIKNASHNIHNLLHLCNDSQNYGPLDSYSAFHFENYMSTILHMIRKNDKPLQQIIRRKGEINSILKGSLQKHHDYPEFKKEHYSGPIITGEVSQYQKVIFSNFILKTCVPDNCCALKDGSVIIVLNFILEKNKKFVLGKRFNKTADFYTQPCHSSELGIHLVNKEDLGSIQSWNVDEIDFKCILLNLENLFSVVLPLVHI